MIADVVHASMLNEGCHQQRELIVVMLVQSLESAHVLVTQERPGIALSHQVLRTFHGFSVDCEQHQLSRKTLTLVILAFTS
jgi:hypothetical protein